MNDQTRFHFYASTPEDCGYLPNRQSISAFANPYMDMDNETYNNLIQFGFRRSGGYLYRPHCPECNECISIRIPVSEFNLSRNDRRTLKKNSDLSIHIEQGKFLSEHFDLYYRYINSRHVGGSMENPTQEDYQRFLLCDWADTQFIEFRQGKRLMAVAVTDITNSGNSAVYTFFDPQEANRSLGHFSILQQIEITQQQQLPFLYLGYWIKDCEKRARSPRCFPYLIFCRRFQ